MSRSPKRRGQEILNRNVEVSSFQTFVSVRAFKERSAEPDIERRPWLELIGTMDEPVREVRDIYIHVHMVDKYQVGTARPPAVGAVVQVRPTLSVVLDLTGG